MATERQIRANRANAAKSTGPKTPEGKRASSQNAARRNPVADTVVLKAESMRRFNDLAAALNLQLKPRNAVEAAQVQTMAAARWHLLRIWGMQTAAFDLEMSRASQHTQASGAVLAAIAFRTLADTSRSFALMHRVEAAYDRQFNRALTLLLKLRKAPDLAAPIDPPLELVTEARDDDSPIEPNFDTSPGNDPTCNEQVPDIASSAPRFEVNPIFSCTGSQGPDAAAPSTQPAVSNTGHESGLGIAKGAASRAANSAVPVDPFLDLVIQTMDDDSQGEPNFGTDSGNDPTCNEQVPDIASNTSHFEMNPISPCPRAPSKRSPTSGFQTPDTLHKGDLMRTTLARNVPPVDVALQPSGP